MASNNKRASTYLCERLQKCLQERAREKEIVSRLLQEGIPVSNSQPNMAKLRNLDENIRILRIELADLEFRNFD